MGKKIKGVLLAALVAMAALFPTTETQAVLINYDASLQHGSAYAFISGPSAYYEIMLLSVQVSLDGSGDVYQPQQWIRTGTTTFLSGTRYPKANYQYAACTYKYYKDYNQLDQLYRTC